MREELGVTVEHAWPSDLLWFTYPHATVRLRFFRVNLWHGDLAPLKHSALIWLTAGAALSVSPILPANAPILRALALPPCYALSNADEHGAAAELVRLQTALANGLRLIQVRDKTLPAAQRHDFAAAVVALAKAHAHAAVMVNDDQALARAVGAQGLHLSSKRLWEVEQRPDFERVSASCHTAADLAQAADLGLSFCRPRSGLADRQSSGGTGHRLARVLQTCRMLAATRVCARRNAARCSKRRAPTVGTASR